MCTRLPGSNAGLWGPDPHLTRPLCGAQSRRQGCGQGSWRLGPLWASCVASCCPGLRLPQLASQNTVPGSQSGEEEQVCVFLGQLRWGEAVRTHLCTHAHAHTFTRGKGEVCAHKRAVAEPSAVASMPRQPNHPVHETHDVPRPTRHVSRNLMDKQKQRRYLNLSPAGGEGTGPLS